MGAGTEKALADELRIAEGNTREAIADAINKIPGVVEGKEGGMSREDKDEEIDKGDAKAQAVADAVASAIATYVLKEIARAHSDTLSTNTAAARDTSQVYT